VFVKMLLTVVLAASMSIPVRAANDLPDKPVRHGPEILAVIQGAALVADGITTRENVLHGQVESDPLARALIGSRPGYGRMIAFGALEELACYGLARRMERTKRFHRISRLPQVIGIIGHGGAAIHNGLTKEQTK
jgi:hypothetical protein